KMRICDKLQNIYDDVRVNLPWYDQLDEWIRGSPNVDPIYENAQLGRPRGLEAQLLLFPQSAAAAASNFEITGVNLTEGQGAVEGSMEDTYQQFQMADIPTQRTDGTLDPGVINLDDDPSVWPPIPSTPLLNPLPPVAGPSSSTGRGRPLVRGGAVRNERISARLEAAPYPPPHFSGSQPTSEESSPINSRPSSQGRRSSPVSRRSSPVDRIAGAVQGAANDFNEFLQKIANSQVSKTQAKVVYHQLKHEAAEQQAQRQHEVKMAELLHRQVMEKQAQDIELKKIELERYKLEIEQERLRMLNQGQFFVVWAHRKLLLLSFYKFWTAKKTSHKFFGSTNNEVVKDKTTNNPKINDFLLTMIVER
ncbi:hypothetical protein BDW22DRAFT_1349316, partial [Trametopsis cervina]